MDIGLGEVMAPLNLSEIVSADEPTYSGSGLPEEGAHGHWPGRGHGTAKPV